MKQKAVVDGVMRLEKSSAAIRALAIVLSIAAVPGCVLPGQQPAGTATFAKALSACRMRHSGATNKRIALPPTEQHVEACLARRGWLPSGDPSPIPAADR